MFSVLAILDLARGLLNGFCLFPPVGSDAESTVLSYPQALYAAKKAGSAPDSISVRQYIALF
jgi:hypothetical protein